MEVESGRREVEKLYDISKYDSKTKKGNSGYLSKWQLKKINPGSTLLKKSDADQNPHHAAAGIQRRNQNKIHVTRSCIWGFKYTVCLPVVSFVSLTVFRRGFRNWSVSFLAFLLGQNTETGEARVLLTRARRQEEEH